MKEEALPFQAKTPTWDQVPTDGVYSIEEASWG